MICKILFEYNRKIAYDMKKCQTLDIKYFQLFVKTSKGKYSLGKLKKSLPEIKATETSANKQLWYIKFQMCCENIPLCFDSKLWNFKWFDTTQNVCELINFWHSMTREHKIIYRNTNFPIQVRHKNAFFSPNSHESSHSSKVCVCGEENLSNFATQYVNYFKQGCQLCPAHTQQAHVLDEWKMNLIALCWVSTFLKWVRICIGERKEHSGPDITFWVLRELAAFLWQ